MEGLAVSFWQGRRVLVTGHTGFKGAWLTLWLQRLGAVVTGCALEPARGGAFEGMAPWADLNDVRLDVRDTAGLLDLFSDAIPEVVLHLAAQALVRPAWADPGETFSTNVMGTVSVLEASSALVEPPAVVVVTSDKVYADPGALRARVETDCLGGSGPYETSKACAELVAQGWPNPALRRATARAGNVIGGGDVAPERIVPDILAALGADRPVALRHPEAIRPWQHVLDPLSGYLRLAQRLVEGPPPPAAVNFGPENCELPVSGLVATAFAEWGSGACVSAPEEPDAAHEAPALRLDSGLAARALDWKARSDAAGAIRAAVRWEKARLAGEELRPVALEELERWGEP